MTVLKKILPLGEIMVSMGTITKAQLEAALKEGKKTNTRVGKVLVSMGFCTEDDIAGALGVQYQIPSVILSSTVLDPGVVKMVPEAIARRYLVIPINMDGDTLQVAMIDPLNVFAIDELRKITRNKIKPLVTTETEIKKAIDLYYRAESLGEMARSAQSAGVELVKEEEEAPEKLEKIAGESSIVQLVNQLINTAVLDNASDIHIEPDEDALRVRMRIDGVLRETIDFPVTLHPAVLSRVKIMGELDIAEKRLPQDGRFFVKLPGREVDVRLSTLPTIFGEKAVLRILDKSRAFLELERLTPIQDTLDVLRKIIKKPFGMILLTGPTGSGKTTTAYTLVGLLNTPEKNLVTVEDPVEYHMKRVNQVQVNAKAGVTFASALRHILRQDPDIIMIGEIRDRETAEIAIHASLTGHIVISTIHTNDAAGTVSRLLDMGIEPYLVSSSITCIVGQRLVRKICDSCKESYAADSRVVEELGLKADAMKNAKFYRGAGCTACKGTGLKGRIGIFEVLLLDDELRAMILAKMDSNSVLDVAKKKGFVTLRAHGIRAALAGHTTVEEVLQATQLVEE